ncbi:leucine-rich repeat domain-containing protein, partial [Wolbachia endosymbiont of Pentidionis agamae]|uniref:hypothetical protein n=1 Tax=Wolbachia endosymbiont of Pentidionis agamae TaxID=3110435 RepID=UPI002FD36E00
MVFDFNQHLNGKTLGLSFKKFDEDDFIQLISSGSEEVKNLESIKLSSCKQITNESIKKVAGVCTNLQSLNLTGTKITDSGLDHLKDLTNLQSLN